MGLMGWLAVEATRRERTTMGIPQILVMGLLLVACSEPRPVPQVGASASPGGAPSELRNVAAFADIEDVRARSVALFVEAGKVIKHPRCSNCHPSGDSPTQRNFEPHVPPVYRGPDGHGVAVLECASCHTSKNAELARVPGAPTWHLAPRSMAWAGVGLGEICEQLKDKDRNGGRTLQQVVDHSANDPLVAWGWAPGTGREPAPGTQQQFAALLAAWVETGAICPPTSHQKPE